VLLFSEAFLGCEGLRAREAKRQTRGASVSGFLALRDAEADLDLADVSDAELASAAANRSADGERNRGDTVAVRAHDVWSDKDDRTEGQSEEEAQAEDEAEAEEELEISQASQGGATDNPPVDEKAGNASKEKDDKKSSDAKTEADQEESNKELEDSEKQIQEEEKTEKQIEEEATGDDASSEKDKKGADGKKDEPAKTEKKRSNEKEQKEEPASHDEEHADAEEHDDHGEEEEGEEGDEEEEEDWNVGPHPSAPFAPLFEEADAVARDVELRNGHAFFSCGHSSRYRHEDERSARDRFVL